MLDKKSISIGDYCQITGDVFIGKKIEETNITINNIESVDDLKDAILNGSSDSQSLCSLLDKLLKHQELREHLNKASKKAFYENASEILGDVFNKLKATGPHGLELIKLKKLLEEAKEKNDLVGASYIALHLLQCVSNEPDVDDYYIQLASEVLNKKVEDRTYYYARIVALCFVVKQKFFAFNSIRARNSLSFQSIQSNSGQFSKESMQKIATGLLNARIDYFKDILEALDLAVKYGNSEAFLLVLNTFLFTYEQDAAFLKYSHSTGHEKINVDIIGMSDRLIEMCKAGLFHETALAECYNNRATFHFLDKDHEDAAIFAAMARDLFLETGNAYSAKIAQKTYSEAKDKKVIDDLDADPFEETTQEQILEYMEENARRILSMKGLDLEKDSKLKADFERGLKNSRTEEVFKFCEHIIVGCDNWSSLAEEIGMISMGQMLVTCRKLGFQSRDFELDNSFTKLKANVCLSCPFHKPRPESWVLTPKFEMDLHDTAKESK